MSGPNTKPQQNIATQQTQLGQQYANLAQQSLGTMNTLEKPAINYYQDIVNSANSGNYSKLLTASGLPISQLTQQNQIANENIYNTMPAGAGRDAALAQGRLNEGQSVAGTLGNTYNQAIGQLQQIASGYGGVGLQEAGAGLSGLSSASQTQGTVMNAQAQSKATTMGFLGSLAGAAGTAASGGF